MRPTCNDCSRPLFLDERDYCQECGELHEAVSLDWIDLECGESCHGDGGHHDCGEDTCCCLDKEEITEMCVECDGEGGYSWLNMARDSYRNPVRYGSRPRHGSAHFHSRLRCPASVPGSWPNLERNRQWPI